MPYKATGKTVLILRDGKWVVLKRHKTEKEAQDHARALTLNVSHKGRK